MSPIQEVASGCCPCIVVLLLGYVGFRVLSKQNSKKKKQPKQSGRQSVRAEVAPVKQKVPMPSELPSSRLLQVREAEARAYGLRSDHVVTSRPSPTRTSKSTKVDPDKVWVPVGKSVSVAGVEITGGMIYVGKELASVHSHYGADPEPALIDPTLVVASKPAHDIVDMGYWPSYSKIPDHCRRRHLEWLASSRDGPTTPIGYVFLYFYGLERRILSDARTSKKAREEVPALLAEVRRLRSIFGENQSFQSYSASLLLGAKLLYSDARLYSEPPDPETAYVYESPETTLAIGQLRADNKPIPGPWALAWYFSHPTTRVRTPAKRCAEEFRELFLLRYGECFPEGMKLSASASGRVNHEQRTASASFAGRTKIPVEAVCDVSRLKKPIHQLQEIADACTDDLDAFSRLLGRKPEARGTLEAFGLLPEALAADAGRGEVGALRSWLASKLESGETAVLPASEVLDRWPHNKPDRLNKKESIALVHTLARLGCGLEPDVRFGGRPLQESDHAVLFRLLSDRSAAPTPEYRLSTTLLHLAAIVAAADGTVSEAEERHLEQHLERSMQLDEDQITRLRAHLAWLLEKPPGLAGLKKRLEGKSEATRKDIARFAIAVAGADGHVDPEEVKTLKKLYKTLGLDPESVYSEIHAFAAAPPTEPVEVKAGRASGGGVPIPPPPAAAAVAKAAEPGSGFDLDMAAVEAKLRDTAEVSHFLTEIFEDDEEPASTREDGFEPQASASAQDPQGAQSERSIAGLDAMHSALLRLLTGREELGRAEFEQLAEGLGLMPDGALDTINDAAFDAVDAPLFEGDDPIEVDQDVLTEMSQGDEP